MAEMFNIKVNGQLRPIAATPDTPLLYVLTGELQLNGPRFGCGLAQCGAAGDVDFSFANFIPFGLSDTTRPGERAPLIASFFRLVVAGTLSFSNAEFPPGFGLGMNFPRSTPNRRA